MLLQLGVKSIIGSHLLIMKGSSHAIQGSRVRINYKKLVQLEEAEV